MPQPINNDTFEVKEKELREAIDFGAFHIADITPGQLPMTFRSWVVDGSKHLERFI